jgi:hypothetical protein
MPTINYITYLYYNVFKFGAKLLQNRANLHHRRFSNVRANILILVFFFDKVVLNHFSLERPPGNFQEIGGVAAIPHGFIQAFLDQSAFQAFKGAI